MSLAHWISGSALSLALLGACTQISMPEAPEGAVFFAQNCSSCHGADATGQGPLSADVTPRPRDLTRLAQENGGTFPTVETLAYIWGTPDGSHLDRVMPQFGPVLGQDLVPLDIDGVMTPTPRTLVGVLAYLESIQR